MTKKAAYSKELFKERKRRYRLRHHTFSLSFSLEITEELLREAKKRKQKVPEYIKSVITAHRESNGYILPPDNRLFELVIALRKIGNNVNQQTRHINTIKGVTLSDYEYLQKKLNEIEQRVLNAVSQPLKVTDVLQEFLNQYPEKRSSLIAWLHDYKNPSS